MSKLRIIPHPELSKRQYKTKTELTSESGTIRAKGTRMHRYLVVGTPEEINHYREVRGEYYIEESDESSKYYGQPIWNSQELYTKPMPLFFLRDDAGIGVQDDPQDAIYESLLKKTNRLGGLVAEKMSSNIADRMFADALAGITTESTAVPVAKPSQSTANTLAEAIEDADDEQSEDAVESIENVDEDPDGLNEG